MTSGNIVIIGGGFSGSLLAINIARFGGPPVTLIERDAGTLGRGLAYGAARPEQLLNVRAGGMSAFPDDPDHFVKWLDRHDAGHNQFVRRRLYGIYLRELLQDAVSRQPDRLRIVVCEARDMSPDPRGGFNVHIEGREQVAAATAVLALGNLPPTDLPSLRASGLAAPDIINDPWREDVLGELGPARTILVLGTGLTAVDTILDVADRGFAGPIIALSRRGLLPQPHDIAQPAVDFIKTVPDKEISALLGDVRDNASQGDWRGAIDRYRPVSQHLWARWPVQMRARFLRHLRPYWDSHRHRLAPDIAGRIDALIMSRQLRIASGKLLDVGRAAGAINARWRQRGTGHVQTARVDRIVNCTGVGSDLRRADDMLTQALLARGAVATDPLNLGIEVDAQCRVRAANGETQAALFCIGPMTRGTFWEVTAVPDIRRQAWDLARRLSNAHWVEGEGL